MARKENQEIQSESTHSSHTWAIQVKMVQLFLLPAFSRSSQAPHSFIPSADFLFPIEKLALLFLKPSHFLFCENSLSLLLKPYHPGFSLKKSLPPKKKNLYCSFIFFPASLSLSSQPKWSSLYVTPKNSPTPQAFLQKKENTSLKPLKYLSSLSRCFALQASQKISLNRLRSPYL